MYECVSSERTICNLFAILHKPRLPCQGSLYKLLQLHTTTASNCCRLQKQQQNSKEKKKNKKKYVYINLFIAILTTRASCRGRFLHLYSRQTLICATQRCCSVNNSNPRPNHNHNKNNNNNNNSDTANRQH